MTDCEGFCRAHANANITIAYYFFSLEFSFSLSLSFCVCFFFWMKQAIGFGYKEHLRLAIQFEMNCCFVFAINENGRFYFLHFPFFERLLAISIALPKHLVLFCIRFIRRKQAVCSLKIARVHTKSHLNLEH